MLSAGVSPCGEQCFYHKEVHLKNLLIIGALLFVFMPFPVHPIDDFTVFSGPKYLGWSPQDSVMPCLAFVRAPQVESKRLKPVMVIMLVDVSRWMEGVALQFAKRGALQVVSGLNTGDYFGLISYATTSQTVYPMQPLRQERSGANMAIDRLAYGDERDLMEGISRAAKEFDRFKNFDALGRYLFIVTDGDPTRGVTDAALIAQRAAEISRQNGITISTFAFKHERRTFNDDLLMNIAYRSNGRYYLQFEINASASDFALETNRISAPAGREVALDLRLPTGVGVTNIRGGGMENNRITLGEMSPGSFRLVTFDLINRPQRSADFVVELTYRPGDAAYQNHSRTFLDIPLSETPQNYNPSTAPFMLLLDFQTYLCDNAVTMISNRAQFTDLYRKKRWELERLKGQVFSDFFNYMLGVLQENEEVIGNNAIDDDLMEKRVKYRGNRIYYGRVR
jgi:uncharacterized protein YegL